MAFRPLRALLIPVSAALLLTQCSCDIFGAAGSLFISEDDERQLGAEFDRQLRDSVARYPIYKANTPAEVEFQNYVTGLAQEILADIPADQKPGYAFTFTIIDDSVENAFAVPGGYVYVYTGIIKTMRDESELAGVLGHEIAHVTRHHYRDALAKQAGLSLLLQALVGDDAGQIVTLVAQSFLGLSSLKVSRDNESEADTYGTRYTGAIGRNPLGIAKYFGRIDGTGFQWFSTHPEPENRVGDVKAQVAASQTLSALAADSNTTNFKSTFEAKTAVLD
jgi:predicted Zn-dependent protease